MKVPFADLKLLHSDLRDELQEAFLRVLDNSSFILGREVETFEKNFAAYCGTQFCVAVNSGTAALHLSLAALGIGPGDEVITVAHTFIASAEAISAVGARPVFVDIDPESYCMDPALLEAAITAKTRAIIPVHLYGQMADMEPILAIAQQHGLPVIEDACQAHGAEYRGKRAGSFGLTGCFSFYPGKNLGACGEGGAVTTNDPKLARRIRMWREHGSIVKYEHEFPGLNMRLEGLQGAILTCKLKSLDRWNDQRREAARIYAESLDQSVLQIPREMDYARHVFHLYVVQVDDRDELRAQLTGAGIETGLHYPIPLHMQKAYEHLGYRRGDFPVTERVVERIVSLPMYPGITEAAVKYVAETVQESCRVA